MPDCLAPSRPCGMYCRACGYDLRGQTGAAPRCQECGRAFDPTRPATFRTRPPRGPWSRWLKRTAILLLILAALLASAWAWLYWGWKSEQRALTNTRLFVDRCEPLGGEQLQAYMGPAGWVLDRVEAVEGLDCTDADLAHFADLTRLRAVGLLGSPLVTDAGLAHLKGLHEIESLYLGRVQVTRAGLAQLKGLKKLRTLRLEAVMTITNAGLAQLKEFKGLQSLVLNGTPVSDDDLAQIKELTGLQELDLWDTKVTDAGMLHLKELKGLWHLRLTETQVTDAGLAQLRELKGLRLLELNQTYVTDAGVAELQRALPNCRIFH